MKCLQSTRCWMHVEVARPAPPASVWRRAMPESVDDWNGVNPPPIGKNGTYATRSLASASTSASSCRYVRLYLFWTQTISQTCRPDATCSAVTLLSPMCRMSPWRWRSTRTSSPARIASVAPSAIPNMLRRLTTARASWPRWRRLSWMPDATTPRSTANAVARSYAVRKCRGLRAA
jgi:hypothetical protein